MRIKMCIFSRKICRIAADSRALNPNPHLPPAAGALLSDPLVVTSAYSYSFFDSHFYTVKILEHFLG